MRPAPSIDAVRGELRRVVAATATRYRALPRPEAVDVCDPTWSALDRAVDAAIAAGDSAAADRAVRKWARHAERSLGGVA